MGASGTLHDATFGVTRSGEDLVIDPDWVASVVRSVTASGRAPACTAM